MASNIVDDTVFMSHGLITLEAITPLCGSNSKASGVC